MFIECWLCAKQSARSQDTDLQISKISAAMELNIPMGEDKQWMIQTLSDGEVVSAAQNIINVLKVIWGATLDLKVSKILL